jgi:23S rRNA (pseudouridine1915-N3)-methyltransferase
MKILIISVGKRHDLDLADAINKYQDRITRQLSLEWLIIGPSALSENQARDAESKIITDKLRSDDEVWLLDERGQNIYSPDLSKKLENSSLTAKRLVIIIGGAYGVNDALCNSADFVWSLSNLVFPHQIVRLLLVEQLYRALEIQKGSGYHHK